MLNGDILLSADILRRSGMRFPKSCAVSGAGFAGILGFSPDFAAGGTADGLCIVSM